METIITLANALVKCSKHLTIIRLDIQYNRNTELYNGYCVLGFADDLKERFTYNICENGEILKLEERF